MTVRVSWRGLTIGAALAFALAGPAKADGLAQFDKLLKPMVPPGALTYKSASALGDNGFVLEDVTVTDTPTAPTRSSRSRSRRSRSRNSISPASRKTRRQPL